MSRSGPAGRWRCPAAAASAGYRHAAGRFSLSHEPTRSGGGPRDTGPIEAVSGGMGTEGQWVLAAVELEQAQEAQDAQVAEEAIQGAVGPERAAFRR